MKLPGVPREPVAPLVLGAVVLAFAFPPFHLVIPSFVGLVPLAVWLARLPEGPEGRREALRGGFLTGLIFFSLLLYWLVVALIFYTPLAVLAFLLPVLILSGFLAAGALGVHQSVRRLGLPVWLVLPIFWTALEWLRAHLGDVSFPWMQLGDSLTGWPRLIGAADLVGARGLSFWLALVNGLLAEAVLRRRPAALERWLPGSPAEAGDGAAGRRPAWRPAVAALVAVVVPVAYSLQRWDALETSTAARVAVVQPNIPEDLKLSPGSAIDSTVTSVATLAREELPSAAGSVDVVLLPEATFATAVDAIPSLAHGGRPDIKRWISGLAGRMGAPVLYGATGIRDRGGTGFDHFNAMFLRSAEGRRVGWYAKRRLVPVIERVPFVPPSWFRGWFAEVFGPYFGGQTPGPAPELLPAGDARFGVLVCYESIFTGLARGWRRQGADFLVNATNDAWYGREEPAWSRTSALWQHPAHLVMRAVENRVGIARAANTGISGVVDPRGRYAHRTGLFEAAAFAAPVLTTPGTTVYARVGDVAGWLAALAAAGVAIASGWTRRRAPAGRGGDER